MRVVDMMVVIMEVSPLVWLVVMPDLFFQNALKT